MVDDKLKQNFTSGITLLKYETVGSRLCACPLLLNGMNKMNYFFYYQGVKKLHYIHKTVLILSIVLILSWSLALDIAVSSEYYKYKDQNGVVHFTDDISEIPKDQRENMTSFQSLESETYSSMDKEEINSSDSPAGEESVSDDKLNETSISLQEERAELEQTFENLQEKRAELAAKAMEKRTSEETKAYKEQVQQLNLDIKRYEELQKQFAEKVEIYNNNIKQKNLSKTQADKIDR